MHWCFHNWGNACVECCRPLSLNVINHKCFVLWKLHNPSLSYPTAGENQRDVVWWWGLVWEWNIYIQYTLNSLNHSNKGVSQNANLTSSWLYGQQLACKQCFLYTAWETQKDKQAAGEHKLNQLSIKHLFIFKTKFTYLKCVTFCKHDITVKYKKNLVNNLSRFYSNGMKLHLQRWRADD